MPQALESDQSRIDEQLRFVNVVCMSLVVSVVLIAFVAWFVEGGPNDAFPPSMAQAAAWGGVALALGLLIAAPFMQRRMLDSARTAGGERQTTALETFRLATMLSFILREGAAIVGLMVALVTGNAVWCYALSLVALGAMFFSWPRREELAGLMTPGIQVPQ